jgi:hypothetical protein
MTDSSRDLSVLPENLGRRLMGMSEGVDDGDNDSLTYVSPSLRISNDPNLVAHGRGLVAAAPIEAGDLLFVHPPTVRAEISQVLRIYKNKANGNSNSSLSTTTSLLESIAETVLLKEMKRVVRGRKKETSARVAASFLALNSNHATRNDGEEAHDGKRDESEMEGWHRKLQNILLGRGGPGEIEKLFAECGATVEDNDHLLGIVRHNAFGPDFHHYRRIEVELAAGASPLSYGRILGHYPLAAMINHSCGPTNATRVFYGDTMVATATQAIPTGTELVWPYCPPSSPFPERSEQLSEGYGFACRSSRSVLEERAYATNIPPPKIPDAPLNLQQWEKLRKALEVWYKVVAAKVDLSSYGEDTNDPKPDQEQLMLLQQGLRLGYTQLYIRYFNETLQLDSQSPSVRTGILSEAKALHAAFSSVHNACTEHLSLLHLCYELSATKPNNNDQRETIRFWTQELKDAHMCRYSKDVIGMDLATLRTVLKHTRTVLRTEDGWQTSGRQNGIQNSFI